MKHLLLLTALFATGCNVDVTPQVENQSYQTETFEVFTGTVDGVDTDFRFPEYTCNASDNFAYADDGGSILNGDSSQVSCETAIKVRTDISENDRPLYGS